MSMSIQNKSMKVIGFEGWCDRDVFVPGWVSSAPLATSIRLHEKTTPEGGNRGESSRKSFLSSIASGCISENGKELAPEIVLKPNQTLPSCVSPHR